MTDTIREQILVIRDTALTNMFDVATVQRLTYDRGYYELVCYLEEDRSEYTHFILTGRGITPQNRSRHWRRGSVSVRDATEDRRPLSYTKKAKSKWRLSMSEQNPAENHGFRVISARFRISPTNRKQPECAETMRFCAFGCSSYPPSAISRKFTREEAAVYGIRFTEI